MGSCGWTIATSDGAQWVQGGGIIPGEPNVQSSYRSELGGQLGIASVLHSLQLPEDARKQSIHITILCDGLSALNTVGKELQLIKLKINTQT